MKKVLLWRDLLSKINYMLNNFQRDSTMDQTKMPIILITTEAKLDLTHSSE